MGVNVWDKKQMGMKTTPNEGEFESNPELGLKNYLKMGG